MAPQAIYIWDLPLRLFHWLLVVALVTCYVTGKLGGLWLEWHARAGVFTFSLIVFRLIWGFIGSTYARFASFFPTPRRLQRFVADGRNNPGHNPLGALSVFALLAVMLIQVGTGLFALNDESEFYGPLYELVSTSWNTKLTHWHTQWVDVLLVLTGLHVLAIAYYTWIKQNNLISPMLTGKDRMTANVTVAPKRGGGAGRFLVAAGIAGVVFWCIASGMLLQWLLPDATSK